MKSALWSVCAVSVFLGSCAALIQEPRQASQRVELLSTSDGGALSVALDRAAGQSAFTGTVLVSKKGKVLLRLSHTSGLPDYTDLPNVEEHLDSRKGLKLRIAAVGKHGKHFEPGRRFEYSNTNYALLQVQVAAAFNTRHTR